MHRACVIQRTLRPQSQQTPQLGTAATHADGAPRRAKRQGRSTDDDVANALRRHTSLLCVPRASAQTI